MQVIHNNTTLSCPEAFAALPCDVQQKILMFGHALPNACRESRANFATTHGKLEYLKAVDADNLVTPKPVNRALLFELNIEALRESLAGHQQQQ